MNAVIAARAKQIRVQWGQPAALVEELIRKGHARRIGESALGVPTIEDVQGRVRFESIEEDGKPTPFGRIVVEGERSPTTYAATAELGSSAGLDRGYSHFLHLCGAMGLLPRDIAAIRGKDPNWHERAGPEADLWTGDLARFANGFRHDNEVAEDEAMFRPARASHCRYVEEYPLDELLVDEVFASRGSAAAWLSGEIESFILDGMAYRSHAYLQLMTEAVHEPVVIAERGIARRVWDGWHRVAASLCKGATHVRAIVVDQVGAPASRGASRIRVKEGKESCEQ